MPQSAGVRGAVGAGAGRRLTLRRADRIRRRADFRETYTLGRKTVCRWLVFFTRPVEGGGPRLGITVTRRCGGAVVRNRVRRRVRELFRTRFREELSQACPSGVDVVVNVRPEGSAAPLAELEADFRRLVGRLGGRK